MAGSARDIQMRELKDTISELNKLIKTLQQTIEAANAREAALCQERDNLKGTDGLSDKAPLRCIQ